MMTSLTKTRENFSEPPLAGNYFVSAYPPFSCWKQEAVPELHRRLNKPGAGPASLGLYIHIPFCTIRCSYCYYFSHGYRSDAEVEKYLDMTVRELEMYGNLTGLRDRQIEFVYFGGGTPSILSAEQLRTFITRIKSIFPWTRVQEASFECSPKTITAAKLRCLREAGITRISLGIQQLNDDVLQKNGRVHLVRDVQHAYELIQQVGFDVVNVDLMVGLVGESEESFMSSLEQTIQMNPDSITIYQLEMPKNTPLYHLFEQGKLGAPPAAWEIKRARLARGFARLATAGFQLRSAYTAGRNASGRRFIYQDAQYHGAELLGIGASSFSFLAGCHFQNQVGLKSYYERIRQSKFPVARAYVLSAEEHLIREFVLQLKLGRVEGQYFKKKFSVDVLQRFIEPISLFQESGFLMLKGDEITLTQPGLLRIDELLPAFYLPEHQGVRYS